MRNRMIETLTIKALNNGYQTLTDEELIALKDYYIQLMRAPDQPPIAQPLCRRELKRINEARAAF